MIFCSWVWVSVLGSGNRDGMEFLGEVKMEAAGLGRAGCGPSADE